MMNKCYITYIHIFLYIHTYYDVKADTHLGT